MLVSDGARYTIVGRVTPTSDLHTFLESGLVMNRTERSSCAEKDSFGFRPLPQPPLVTLHICPRGGELLSLDEERKNRAGKPRRVKRESELGVTSHSNSSSTYLPGRSARG